MISKQFILAGRAIFTLEVPASFRSAHADCKAHYTFRVRKSEPVLNNDGSVKWPEAWWVNLLAGPDNTSDYRPIGKINHETGAIALTRNSAFTENCWPVKLLRRLLVRVWADDAAAVEAAGFALHHEGRCGRCGRRLTVPRSILTGLGPECEGKM